MIRATEWLSSIYCGLNENLREKMREKPFSAWFMHKVATRECFSRNRLTAVEVAAAVVIAYCASSGYFSIDTEAVFFSQIHFSCCPFSLIVQRETSIHLLIRTHCNVSKFNSILKKSWRDKIQKHFNKWVKSNDIWMNAVFIFRLSCKIYRCNSISLHRRVYIEGAVIFFFLFLLYNMPT